MILKRLMIWMGIAWTSKEFLKNAFREIILKNTQNYLGLLNTIIFVKI
jgi:hypothetical protein